MNGSRYKRAALNLPLDDDGNNNNKLFNMKRIGLLLTIIVTSMIIGGFVFDWIAGIVRKDIKVGQHSALIETLSEHLKLLEQENAQQKITDAQFQTEILERLKMIEESAKTRGHIVWDLDKKWKGLEEWQKMVNQRIRVRVIDKSGENKD